MYKVYYSPLENAYEEDNESLSSSFWTDQESEEQDKCYVVDERIETELGLYKQEINKEVEWNVKDNNVNEQTGEKLQEGDDSKTEYDQQSYVKEQSEDEDSGEQVSQHDVISVEGPGEENNAGEEKRNGCKAGTDDEESEDHTEEGCAGEEMSDSEHFMIENLHPGNYDTESKEEESDADNKAEENNEEEQSKCFFHEKNVSMSLEEESESEELESEEEIEYFAGAFTQGVMKGEEPEGAKLERVEEWKTFFVNQDDMSESVMNDGQMCTEKGQAYNQEQYPERRMPFMAEQCSNSINKDALLDNRDGTEEAQWVDRMYTEHGESDGSVGRTWQRSADVHENGVYTEDFCGSASSLTASILTSGYGTYKPDSPKDDCSLFEQELDIEYSNAPYTQDDLSVSWYRDWLSSDVTKQTPLLSLNGDDWSPFDSFIVSQTDSVQGTTDENKLGCTTLCPEDSQTRSLSAESADLAASVEKSTGSVHLQVTRTNNQSGAFYWEDGETFPVCRNDTLNVRLDEYMTTIKDNQTEDGYARQDFRKTKRVKSHHLRRG